MRNCRPTLCWGLLLVLLFASDCVAADLVEWQPAQFAAEDTLDMRTTGPDEGEYWAPVWLVVVDDQVFIRLGSKAVARIQANTTAPIIGVRIAGKQFDKVRADAAPDYVDRVAAAMGDKYWSDLFIRFFPHPMTLKLTPLE